MVLNMDNEIVLATSISPRNIENQQRAMESWIASGFKIISCNVKSEIEQIETYFPNVEFVELSRSAQAVVGKPCPFMYDILQVLKAKAGKVCGIINSDIHLRNCSDEMYCFIEEHASDALVYARRQEVSIIEDMDILNSYMFFSGVDTFFFHKSVIDDIEDDGLIMGQGMWDYWFPIMLYESGIPVVELINPITFHVRHASEWSKSFQFEVSQNICQKHFKQVPENYVVKYLEDKFFEIITECKKICYVTERLKEQKVLVVGHSACPQNIKEAIQRQTHSNVVYKENTSIQGEDYDYQVYFPYEVRMDEVFIDALLWIMENYSIEAMRIFPYLYGNISHIVRRENCMQSVLEKMYEDMEFVTIYQRKAYLAGKRGGDVCMKFCKVHLCTILAEEDFGRIWERQKIEGRTYIFPAGRATRAWLDNYKDIAKEITIKGLLDNNPMLIGKNVQGICVYSPEILKDTETYENVLVISNLYAEELVQQLKEIIPEEKIVAWRSVFRVEMSEKSE